MNWTGGRLQRSKANANSLVKTRKHHFAKARLRLQHRRASQSPFALSISHGRYSHNTEMQDGTPVSDHHRPRKRSHSQDASDEVHMNYLDSHGSRHHSHNSSDEPQTKCRRSEGPLSSEHGNGPAIFAGDGRPEHDRARKTKPSLPKMVDHSRKSAAADVNTLQNVKRNLLEKTDWMSLSVARPLKMAFTPVEEMENIGKRRKIARADEPRTAAAQPDSRFHLATNRHHRIGQHRASTSILHTEDASFRIGSNIYHTQTTPRPSNKERPPPSVSQCASTDSMLLDKLDCGVSPLDQAQTTKEAPRPTDGYHSLPPRKSLQYEFTQILSGRARASSADEIPEVDTGRVLPTLDQLRDSKSFDELKVGSASRSSKGQTFPPLSLPRLVAQSEFAEYVHSVKDSSSVVDGRRVLPSYDSLIPVGAQNSVADQNISRSEILRECHAKRAGGNKLSGVFWPEHTPQSMSQAELGMAERNDPSASRVQENPTTGPNANDKRTIADGTTAAEPRYQENLVEVHLPQPVFALEQQVSDEGMIKGQMDASPSSPFNLGKPTDSIGTTSSTTKSKQSFTNSSARCSQCGGSLHYIEPLFARRGDVAIFKAPPVNASGSGITNLGATSYKDISLKLLSGAMQISSQDASEVILHPNLMPRPTILRHGLRTWHTREDEDGPSNSPSRSSWSVAARDREANNNGAQTDSVIPEFDEIRNAFEVEPIFQRWGPNGKVVSPRKALEAGEIARLNSLTWKPHLCQTVQTTSPAKSPHTSANTVLYRAEDLPSPQPWVMTEPSETDFLTQISPMGGNLDERLPDISVYNKGARSVRSFVAAPSVKTRSLSPIESDEVVAWAHNSELDITPFRVATDTALLGVQDTDPGAQEPIFSRHEHFPSFGSTRRQLLQSPNEMSVVSTQSFAWTPQAGGRGALNVLRLGSSRPSSPRPNLAGKTHDDMRLLRTRRQPMSSLPIKSTPIRRKPRYLESTSSRMTTPGCFKPSQAFPIQLAHDPIAESVPRDHESSPQEGQTLSALGAQDNETFDEYPFADEDALHMLSTDSSTTYSGSPGSISALARPGPVLHNIHTQDQQFTFKKPRPFIGIQDTLRHRTED